MDTFITIISCIAGFFLSFVLLLSFLFSAAGAAQTNKLELKIISWISILLFIWLAWSGVSSLSVSDDVNTAVTTAQNTSLPAAKMTANSIFENKTVINGLYILYVFATLAFFSWLFTPSKSKKSGKDLVRKKFLASATLQEDEAGRKPWDKDWNPEEASDSDTKR